MNWIHTEGEPIPKWKVGIYGWKKDGEWRLRLYRPWRKERLIEVQCAEFIWALYCLGIGAGWWKEKV